MLIFYFYIEMYNPYSNSHTSYASCQMLNPLEPGFSYPSPPPPPPMHTVFTNYGYEYYPAHPLSSSRQMQTGQPDSHSGSNKRKMEDQVLSSSPLSSSSCSSSASFPEVNDREEPTVKRSKKVTPKKARRQSSANTVSEDSESDAESRQRSLERNRLAASKCRQRKKEWVDELAHKAEKMTRENEYLKQMLVQLKEETLYLKSQLIIHKNNNGMNTCQNKPFINLF